MLVKAIRNGLGMLIVGVDRLTRPKPIMRSSEQQAQAQQIVKGLSLYQLYACPFCVKARRAIHQLNVNIELCDIGKNPDYRHKLKEEGGRVMVPCLRIDEGDNVRWLYESNEIIAYLKRQLNALSV